MFRPQRPISRTCLGVLFLVLSLGFLTVTSTAAVVFEEQTLVTSGQGGFDTYRIPAAIYTTDNTVLFFCEARKTSGSDFAETHMLLRRSEDGGLTWQEPQIVWKDTSEPEVTIGNPCPVYDAATGKVWLGFTRNNERVFVTSSDDNGKTWATPTEISSSVTPDDCLRYWTGPGHGLQLTQGDAAGRLIFPSYRILDEGERNVMRSLAIYSDDHGATWQTGEGTAIGSEINPDAIHKPPASWIPGGYDWEGCECVAVEATDGRVYLTVRNQAGVGGHKGFAWSNDGGVTWSPMELQDELPGLTCQSSVIRFSNTSEGRANRILYSGITNNSGGRSGLSVYLSEDEARTFPTSRVVAPGPSAYSDLVVLPDKTAMVFYEGGSSRAYETIRVARFNLEWLTSGESIVNGDFEETTGWGSAGTKEYPLGWSSSSTDRTSAAQPQTGDAAIGGSGTSAFFPAAPDGSRDLAQSFPQSSPKWVFEMDFAAEEPDGQGSDHRTLSLGWRNNEGIRFYMIVTGNGNEGASADGLGDVQIYNPASGYFTPAGLENSVRFDDDVETTPMAHHLRIEGDFTADTPFYDIHITDAEGTVHSATGLTLFNGGTPGPTSGLIFFSDNTFLSTGDHLLDNIRVSGPEKAEPLSGDLNADGHVDSGDLDIVRGFWGWTVEAGCRACGDAKR